MELRIGICIAVIVYRVSEVYRLDRDGLLEGGKSIAICKGCAVGITLFFDN
jgi:hypothetical protein